MRVNVTSALWFFRHKMRLRHWTGDEFRDSRDRYELLYDRRGGVFIALLCRYSVVSPAAAAAAAAAGADGGK